MAGWKNQEEYQPLAWLKQRGVLPPQTLIHCLIKKTSNFSLRFDFVYSQSFEQWVSLLLEICIMLVANVLWLNSLLKDKCYFMIANNSWNNAVYPKFNNCCHLNLTNFHAFQKCIIHDNLPDRCPIPNWFQPSDMEDRRLGCDQNIGWSLIACILYIV